MIKSSIFILATLVQAVILALLISSSRSGQRDAGLSDLMDKKDLVSVLSLTDFAIWTEARYTRHPSQADFFSSFQDFPGAFDHFPAGSIIAPPAASREKIR